MIRWPDSLVQDIARRRAILFLGSGVSKNSVSELDPSKRPPTWDQFLQGALDTCSNPKRHIQQLLKKNDYLAACEIIKYKMDESWNQFVHQQFVEPRFKAAQIHEDIFKLDAWQLNCLFGLHQPTTKVSEQTNSLSCIVSTRRDG